MLRRTKTTTSVSPGAGDAESGIALLIVLFIVALASIVVVNLSYSTFIQARTIGMISG